VAVYHAENNQYYPIHSSSSDPSHPAYADPRKRWPDYLHPYMKNTDIYLSPNLDSRELGDFKKVFAHTATLPVDQRKYFGGYGYNYQYLGNSRPNPTFHARNEADIKNTTQTVVIGDVAGSRKGSATALPGAGGEAVYAL